MNLRTRQLAREIFIHTVPREMYDNLYITWEDLARDCYNAADAFVTREEVEVSNANYN